MRSHSNSWKWLVCGLLFLATLLNYLDRQTLSIATPLIREDMKLDLAQLGMLFSVFYWTYAVAQMFAGLVVDRVNVRYAYATAVTCWSLAGAAAGFARGFLTLLCLRMLLGLFESANWPLALRVVSQLMPPRQRSLANGIFQSGASFGALIAPPLIIFLAKSYGWRIGFVVIGLTGLLWTSLWLGLFSPPLQPEPLNSGDESPLGKAETIYDRQSSPLQGGTRLSFQSSVAPPGGTGDSSLFPRSIFRSQAFLGLLIASVFLNPCLYFYVNWLPTYFVASGQQFGQQLAGRLFVIYLALDIGYLSGGILAFQLSRRLGLVKARLGVTSAGALLMMGIPIISKTQGIGWITALICLATLGVGWFMVNYLSWSQEISFERVSTVTGLLGSAGAFSGGVFMWLVGVLSKASGNFTLPVLLVGAMPVLAFGGIWVHYLATSSTPQPDAALTRA